MQIVMEAAIHSCCLHVGARANARWYSVLPNIMLATTYYILYARIALPAHTLALALDDKSRDISSKNASISPGGNVAASTGQLLAHMQKNSHIRARKER